MLSRFRRGPSEILSAGFRPVEDPSRPPGKEQTVYCPTDGTVQHEVSRTASVGMRIGSVIPISVRMPATQPNEPASNFKLFYRYLNLLYLLLFLNLDAPHAASTFIKERSSTRAKKMLKMRTTLAFVSIGFISR